MIISTAGSRVIPRKSSETRRKTLLEISKAGGDDHITEKRRTSSNPEARALTDVNRVDMSGRRKAENIGPRKDAGSKKLRSGMKTSKMDFKSAWINIVSEKDVAEITSTQRQTLRKYEETNEMLRHFNNLSESTFIGLQKDYASHVQLLCSLKNDLDQIFRRLRSLKSKMNDKYPEAVEATLEAVKLLQEKQMMEMEYEMPRNQCGDNERDPIERLPEYSEHSDDLEKLNVCTGENYLPSSIQSCDGIQVTNVEEIQLRLEENFETNDFCKNKKQHSEKKELNESNNENKAISIEGVERNNQEKTQSEKERSLETKNLVTSQEADYTEGKKETFLNKSTVSFDNDSEENGALSIGVLGIQLKEDNRTVPSNVGLDENRTSLEAGTSQLENEMTRVENVKCKQETGDLKLSNE